MAGRIRWHSKVVTVISCRCVLRFVQECFVVQSRFQKLVVALRADVALVASRKGKTASTKLHQNSRDDSLKVVSVVVAVACRSGYDELFHVFAAFVKLLNLFGGIENVVHLCLRLSEIRCLTSVVHPTCARLSKHLMRTRFD